MSGEPRHGQPKPVSENLVSSADARPSWLVTILAGILVVLGAIWVLFVGFAVLAMASIGIGKGASAIEVLLVSLVLFLVVSFPGLVFVYAGYGLFRRRR